jgi:MFS family permease
VTAASSPGAAGWPARPTEPVEPRRRSTLTPHLRTLLVGQAVSALGDWMGTVALMALVLELTGSATAVGGVLVLRLVPTIAAGPLAARLLRRWSRRRIMLAMDLIRVPAALLLPWVTQLWWIYAWALLIELAGMVFMPARDASIPDLQEPGGDLALANGLVLGSSYGMIPVGAGTFALVAAVAGGSDSIGAARVVFAVDAVTFLVSFLAIARLPETTAREAAAGDEGSGEATTGRFRDALRLPLVRKLAPVAAVVAGGLGALFSLGVVWVRDVLDATDPEFGLLVACFGVGAGCSLVVLRLVSRRDLAMIRVLLFAQGMVVATMSLAPAIGFALLGAVAFGGLAALVLAMAMELLQREVGDRDRMLAFAAFHVVVRGGLAIAAIGAGVADDLLREVDWPVVGDLASSQVVLMSSGILVAAVAALTRPVLPTPAASEGDSPR